MKGGGYYSQRTRGAKDVIDNASGMLVEAADAINPSDSGGPIVLADFGAADGGTSESALRTCIEQIRTRFPDNQIQVTYTDLPSNDFGALFKNLSASVLKLPALISPISRMCLSAPAVLAFTATLPGCLSGCWLFGSCNALHLRKPCPIANHVTWWVQTERRGAYADKARQDWNDLLVARAKDYAPAADL